MNSVLPALAASAIAFGSPPEPALQHSCPLNVPTTAEAAQSAELLKRAARGVCELVHSRNEHIASLWVYPTNSANTVYVQYTSMKARSLVNAEHLAVAEMEGDRIAHWRTSAMTGSAHLSSRFSHLYGSHPHARLEADDS